MCCFVPNVCAQKRWFANDAERGYGVTTTRGTVKRRFAGGVMIATILPVQTAAGLFIRTMHTMRMQTLIRQDVTDAIAGMRIGLLSTITTTNRTLFFTAKAADILV